MLTEWRDLLFKRGIYVKSGRTRSQFEYIFDVLYWAEYTHTRDIFNEMGTEAQDKEDQDDGREETDNTQEIEQNNDTPIEDKTQGEKIDGSKRSENQGAHQDEIVPPVFMAAKSKPEVRTGDPSEGPYSRDSSSEDEDTAGR